MIDSVDSVFPSGSCVFGAVASGSTVSVVVTVVDSVCAGRVSGVMTC